ncbi:O-antigen/teichoic acid export membrane protein [Pedobacter sp. UYP30]|uniref:MATE family efflux transporter n=1 Tax=Pedobacter sp. UYP30 TaxID=1756400 RepID=UPI003391C0DE
MDKNILKWNFIFQYGYVITNIFNSLILLPFYLHKIDASTLGLWLATGNILAWMTLADPGVGDVLQQKIAQLRGKNEVEEINLTIGSGILTAIFILIIAIIAGVTFYFLIGTIINKDVSQYKGLQTALLISIIATGMSLVSFSLSGINQGLQNSAQVAISSLSGNFVFLIINIILLFSGFGVVAIAFANLCRAFYINIYNYSALRKQLQRDKLKIIYSTAHLKKFIKIFSFTSLSRIIGGFSASLDMIFLARFIAPSMITIFEINKRPIQMTQSLVGRHSVALMPLISHAQGKGDYAEIKSLIYTQFKYYSYAAIFLVFVFIYNYENLITLWTGNGKYAGNTVVHLLVASFFFTLIGYFSSNMGYALGDIKVNSFITIMKGIISGLLYYFSSKYYGLVGLLIVMVAISIGVDFTLFSLRLHKVGFLDGKFVTSILKRWVVIIPLAAGLSWAIAYGANLIVPSSMKIISIMLNGALFSVLFATTVLTIDKELKETLRLKLSSIFSKGYKTEETLK